MDPNRQGGNQYGHGASSNYNPARFHPYTAMDPNRQGVNPNGRGAGAYSNYNPAQPLDHPSSSARPRPARLLPLLTSSRQLQPPGAYSSGVDFAPLGVTMPGPAVYHYSHQVAPPRPSVPDDIGSQYLKYQPHHGSVAVFPAPAHNPVSPPEAGVYAQQPSSATVFNAPGYNGNPHASVNQPGGPLYAQPGAATGFPARGGNTNDGPYTSAGLVAPPANANQGASRGPVPGDPYRSRLELLNAQANELLVFVQRANTRVDVEAIVDDVIEDQNNGLSLMEVTEPIAGEIALKDLVRLVASMLGPRALRCLFKCLVDGWIMEQNNGPQLLQYFFETRGHVQCSIFIDELALPCFLKMATSRIGHMSMLVCVRNAGDTWQGALHNAVVLHTVEIASNLYGSILLRTIFQTGGHGQLQERIRERVEENLVKLSMCECGYRVVQACFVPSSTLMFPYSVLLLRSGLQAFMRLPGEQLRELLHNHSARYVFRRLLLSSEHLAAVSAVAVPLAAKILGVGGAGDELNSIARRVIDGRPRRQLFGTSQ